MKNVPFFLLLLFLLNTCANHGQLTYVAKLPKSLKENSGMASFGNETIWFVEDSGNGDDIHQVNLKGTILKKLEVKNAKNNDWEDLAQDSEGNLYIGDFGNNDNDRKNLVIYKTPNPEDEPGGKIDAEKIAFNYPEQKGFPPKKKERVYDAEAFFHYNGHLYIFTKNRGNPFTGETGIYKIPDSKGDYKAEFLGTLKTCSDWDLCKVTSADISEDKKTVVLLGTGKIWVLTDFTADHFSTATLKEIDLGVRTQLESVRFINQNTLLLSDEEKGSEGRNLYSFKLP